MNTNFFKILSLSFFVSTNCFYSLSSLAEELDAASSEALVKTQELLKDPAKRAKPPVDTAQGRWIKKQTESLAGSKENTERVYDLTADILSSLVQETGGDPAKMMELVEQAKKDPAGFAKRLTPEQRAKLHGIAGAIEPTSKIAPNTQTEKAK